jgi:hypothetical protein
LSRHAKKLVLTVKKISTFSKSLSRQLRNLNQNRDFLINFRFRFYSSVISESWIYYFEDKPSSSNVKQCSKALELLTFKSDSSSSPSKTVCLSVYKSLANFWLFIHKWKVVTEKLTNDLESHLKKVDQKQQTQITEEEREALAAEMVNSFFTILTLVTWNIQIIARFLLFEFCS